jgi:hypothetical protein
MMCFANARLILRASEQPQPLRTLQRSERQQRPQWPADRIRCRPFRRRHGLLAIPVAGMRKETASRPAAARRGAVAPIAEQIALRLRHIGVALCIGQHAPLLSGHPPRKPPIPRRHLSPHRLLLRSAHCVPRLAMGAPLSSPLYVPLREKGAGRTNERRGQACRHARPRSSFARTRNAQAEREKGNRSRGASSAPEACSPRCHKAKSYEALPPANKREAERRKAHCPINVRVKRGCALLSWRRAAFRRSRLRHSPPGSTPMAQLQNRVSRGLTDRCFARFAKLPRLSTLRADRSLCRSTGDPKPPGGRH